MGKQEKPEGEKEKSKYQMIIDGDAVPEGCEKGWKNLQPEKYNFAVMDKEKHREISRKGAEAVNKIHGEKRTAKQALENILTLKVSDEIIAGADLSPELAERFKRSLPDATVYDLINVVAAGRAVGGNLKAYELIRDTYGDAPIKQVEITENITTDADRALLQSINERLQAVEIIETVEATEPGAEPADDGSGTDKPI